MGLSSAADVSMEDLSSIPERVGYLKDLGLDYGWGPTSVLEYVLEHIHLWTGWPWWGSIIALGVLIRQALFKPSLDALVTGAKARNVEHEVKPLREQIRMNQRSDQFKAMQAKAELARIYRKNGIKTSRALLLPALQLPLGFCMYRLIEAMCRLPVPELASESVAWIKDLTIPDPLFILPIVSTGVLYLNLRVWLPPGRAGASSSPYFGKMLTCNTGICGKQSATRYSSIA